MKKIIKKIVELRNAFDGRLRGRLDALSPKARLVTVLVMSLIFAAGSIAMLGTAIKDFGKGKGGMQIEHIEHLELPSRERRAVPSGYGTERPDCETLKHDTNETE